MKQNGALIGCGNAFQAKFGVGSNKILNLGPTQMSTIAVGYPIF
jgi:hypothetical protein